MSFLEGKQSHSISCLDECYWEAVLAGCAERIRRDAQGHPACLQLDIKIDSSELFLNDSAGMWNGKMYNSSQFAFTILQVLKV